MPVSMSSQAVVLRGRGDECAQLDRLREGALAGRGGVLVLRGEAGVGKTALLDYVIATAPAVRAIRVAGIESEMELAFAALHQLCAPILDRLDRVPGPQRDALETTFGLKEGTVPDRLLVGLAVEPLVRGGSGAATVLRHRRCTVVGSVLRGGVAFVARR